VREAVAMRECICCQCEEDFGQFRNYVQCLQCDLYGHEDDDFSEDPNREVCNDCVKERQAREEDSR
jgi:hypothetical protein